MQYCGYGCVCVNFDIYDLAFCSILPPMFMCLRHSGEVFLAHAPPLLSQKYALCPIFEKCPPPLSKGEPPPLSLSLSLPPFPFIFYFAFGLLLTQSRYYFMLLSCTSTSSFQIPPCSHFLYLFLTFHFL